MVEVCDRHAMPPICSAACIDGNFVKRLLLIAGPCQIESESHCKFIANSLKFLVGGLPIDLVFKASYDKANRTSVVSPRGIGQKEGMRVLREIRETLNLRVTTDVHSVKECIESQCDIIQIPALLSRQTDLLTAAASNARVVNIKKGQFSSPQDMKFAVGKAKYVSPKTEVWLTERGTTFGYNDLVVDFRSIGIMKNSGANKVIFDASHSSQRPNSLGDSSGGDVSNVEPLALAALAVGVDGLFIEVHDDPEAALSDGPIAWPLKSFRSLLERLLEVWEVGQRYHNSSKDEILSVAR